MPADALTPDQVSGSLFTLGNYAVLRAQLLCKPTFVPASVLIALGLRESGLQNICGGAAKINGVWVPVKTDRGWLQITDTLAPNRAWLASVPGCPDGSWVPAPRHTALEPLHCPTFSNATYFTLSEFGSHRRQALAAGVKVADSLRFCVAAHNAGYTGALNGYREGNVDANTTLGDYSWWVLHYAPQVRAWIDAHPAWRLP